MSHEGRWRDRLAELHAHAGAHGRLPLQRDALGLGEWISRQRKANKAIGARRNPAG
jgi:hypothetical protein